MQKNKDKTSFQKLLLVLLGKCIFGKHIFAWDRENIKPDTLQNNRNKIYWQNVSKENKKQMKKGVARSLTIPTKARYHLISNFPSDKQKYSLAIYFAN